MADLVPQFPQFPHLAPDQHGAEDDLQAVEEVVSDEDDGGSAGRPAFTRADGFDAGRGCFGNTDATTAEWMKLFKTQPTIKNTKNYIIWENYVDDSGLAHVKLAI